MFSQDQSFFDLLRMGGIALIPLGICSVLVIAVALERWWAYTHIGVIPRELMRRVETLIAAGDWHEALRLLDETKDSPFARIAKAGLQARDGGSAEISDALTLACDLEVAESMRMVPVLGTIGNIAPFIGLFGTVFGIMRAFHDMGAQRSAGSDVVSTGIAEALIATAVGLGVGIVAVVANNWALAWVERYRLTLEHFATGWAHSLRRQAAHSRDTEGAVV